MLREGPAKKVTIFINEDAPYHKGALHDAIMSFLMGHGVSGATATRGYSGFGSHHHLHTPKIELMAFHLPIRLEFIETAEKVDQLLPALSDMVTEGLIEVQDTTVVKLTGPSPMSRRDIMKAGAFLPAAMLPQNDNSEAALRRMLEPPSGKVQVVIDSDTYNEIDDQYAVAYAILSPEKMNVEAIYAAPYLNDRSTSPADGMEKSYQEILRLLKFLSRDSANFVFHGSDRFFGGDRKPVESPAARDLIARAMRPRPAPLYVLTLGCPVNVSSAILMEPRIKEKIVVVWLGGASHDWPSAREFNLQQDLHASRVLFDSGVPLVQIPTKNVSEHLRTTLPEVERFMKGRSKLGDYLYNQFVEYYQVHTKGKPQPYPWSKVIWDISTVAWVNNPGWIPSALVSSPMLTDDMKWQKQTGRHPIRVATNVLRDDVFYDLFEKLAKSDRK